MKTSTVVHAATCYPACGVGHKINEDHESINSS